MQITQWKKNLKRLHTEWLHLYYIPEKTKLCVDIKISGYPEFAIHEQVRQRIQQFRDSKMLLYNTMMHTTIMHLSKFIPFIRKVKSKLYEVSLWVIITYPVSLSTLVYTCITQVYWQMESLYMLWKRMYVNFSAHIWCESKQKSLFLTKGMELWYILQNGKPSTFHIRHKKTNTYDSSYVRYLESS